MSHSPDPVLDPEVIQLRQGLERHPLFAVWDFMSLAKGCRSPCQLHYTS
jgi:hypothetical protein